MFAISGVVLTGDGDALPAVDILGDSDVLAACISLVGGPILDLSLLQHKTVVMYACPCK